MKPLHFKTYSLLILFTLITTFAYAQNYEATKTLNKNASVSANANINVSNYSGDLKITTSDANTVKMVTTVKISGKTKEDVEKVIQAIENFEFDHSGNSVNINTRFYKNMQSLNNRKTVTLENGSKAKIREFKINHELQIPKTAHLDLSNKYSDIDIQQLSGTANFNLYSSKLHGNNISNDVQIESKYSKIYLKDISGKMDLDLYDSDIEFISCGDLKVKSKYSKINAKKVESLSLESYDDKFFITQISNLQMNAKYSDLKSEANSTNLFLELYDCNIEVSSAKNSTFKGKYSDLVLGDVKILKIDDSFDNNITLGKTEKVELGRSKYSKYVIDEITSFSIDDGYDDNMEIRKLNNEFSGIKINGKYCKFDLNVENVPYRLNFKIKYPKIDIPTSIKTIKHIEKSGNLELEANETGGLISVEGYDMKVVIK